MRRFGREEKMSDVWFDVKGDLERVMETLEDIDTKDSQIFNKVQEFKSAICGVKSEVKSLLIDALQKEE